MEMNSGWTLCQDSHWRERALDGRVTGSLLPAAVPVTVALPVSLFSSSSSFLPRSPGRSSCPQSTSLVQALGREPPDSACLPPTLLGSRLYGISHFQAESDAGSEFS